jgi:hypothetical protein
VSTTHQAQQNREYVRRMLKKKQPEFAAVLEWVVWELARQTTRRRRNQQRQGQQEVAFPSPYLREGRVPALVI